MAQQTKTFIYIVQSDVYSIHHLVVVVVLLGVLLTGRERNAMVGVIRF